jgi:hypothetical protein
MKSVTTNRTNQLRWWLLLAALAFVATSAVLWSGRAREGAVASAAQEAVAFPAAAPAVVAESAPAIAAPTDAQPASPPLPNGPVGEAEGVVRIAMDNASTYELKIRQAVGVWQPGQSRLRIALASDAIDYQRAIHLLDTLAGEGIAAREGAPPAMLELVFTPTAQAFSQEELERATLLTRDPAGRLVQADVLGALRWNGSLPSPQVGVAAQVPSQVEMKLTGSGFATDNPAVRPSWDLSLSVPVGLRW